MAGVSRTFVKPLQCSGVGLQIRVDTASMRTRDDAAASTEKTTPGYTRLYYPLWSLPWYQPHILSRCLYLGVQTFISDPSRTSSGDACLLPQWVEATRGNTLRAIVTALHTTPRLGIHVDSLLSIPSEP